MVSQLMGYNFQVVPLDDLKLFSKLLSTINKPIDRHAALRLGACSLIVIDFARQCLNGIAEEKRCLAIWGRNQRSSIRFIRGKGSSNTRALANASISNQMDAARNTLDWLKTYAPECIESAQQRLPESLSLVNKDEATSYIEIFRAEIYTTQKAQEKKRFMYVLLLVGLILVLIVPPLGICALIWSLHIYLTQRQSWQRLSEAETYRKRKIGEIQALKAEETAFDEQLADKIPDVIDESLPASIVQISSDLQKEYVFLDVACRDLGSEATSWNELASEMISEERGESIHDVMSSSNGPPQTSSLSKTLLTFESDIDLEIPISMDSQNIIFKLGLQQARQILACLGYKRMPREWATISLTAEEKICRYLAAMKGIGNESYFWRFDEYEVRAEPY